MQLNNKPGPPSTASSFSPDELVFIKGLLRNGDQTKIAIQFRVCKSDISEALKGEKKKPRILNAIRVFIKEENREAEIEKEKQAYPFAKAKVDALILDHYPTLKKYSRRIAKQREEAEDLLHDTIVALLTRLVFRAAEPTDKNYFFTAFAYKVMENEYRSSLKKCSKKRIYYCEQIHDDHFKTSFETNAEATMIISEIQSEIEKTPPMVNKIINKIIECDSPREVYRAMGMPQKQVDSIWKTGVVPFQNRIKKALELDSSQYPTRQFI